jgi:type I restriction enzyme R subunit
MPVTGGNFDHLEEFDAALARFGAHAERYFLDDANTALIKVRQFAERLAMVVSERSGLDLEPRAAFADVLRALQIDGSAPREILDLLHRLRKIGNTAVHDAAGERREAFDAIKTAHQLGVWLRASLTNQPRLTMAFRPPQLAPDEAAELRSQVEALRARLAERETAAETAARLAREAEDARLTAEDRARLAEEERAIYAALAEEAETKATARPAPEAARRFVAAAVEAARDIDLDEDDTRLLIDEQLRAAGWEVDSRTLRHGKGARPEKGRSRAIAEWPTASGPADYALFVGEALVGVVEAKRRRRDVSAAVHQAERYAEGIDLAQGGSVVGGPWGKFIAPFAFATNGRAFYPQFRLQSGIWRRDLRRASNPAEPLEGWPTPDGLMERLALDRNAAEAALKDRPFDFGFELRPYQIAAIRAVEGALAADQREMLVAMATGTGKTKLSIALIYRLLEAKRFNRVCFVVDRSALGEQAEGAFRTTRVLDARTFADVFGLKGLGDRDIDRDAKVHVCTVQSMVQRVLGRAPEDRPPVDQYDLILIDECHRGYLLDREMSDAEMAFRDQDDYVSKYRRVVEYFDAVKIGLTATPALHTAQIFGEPIFRYSYREAVVDGFLIDHDPPHLITTALSRAGITFEEGETVEALNTVTGEIDTATLEDRLAFSVEHFNRKVLAPEFNRVVAEELTKHIDVTDPEAGKTLVFAASDRHADEVVHQLRVAWRDQGLKIEDGMIRKVTGSVDKVGELIRSYKNDDFPRVAVTVDLLTTGVDVPRITNLVFLRRVNSRILYDQMIGRATRLCPEIGKEVFQIFDAVDLYPHLEQLTEMRPVVVNPAVTFETLFDGLEGAEDAAHQEQILDQIIVKLARKMRRMTDDIRGQYEAQAGETPEDTLARFRGGPAPAVRDWARERPGLGAFFDFEGPRNGPPIIPIHSGPDTVVAVTRGYGAGVRPADFIDAFAAFVRENANGIAALQTVLTRPRDLTRADLKALRLALDARQFTEANLRAAWRDQTNDDVAASIIGFVRQAALGDPLIPYARRVDDAVRAVAMRRALTQPQRRWLDRIGEQIKRQTVLDRAAFAEPPFAEAGGFDRIDTILGGGLQDILTEIADQTWNPAA